MVLQFHYHISEIKIENLGVKMSSLYFYIETRQIGAFRHAAEYNSVCFMGNLFNLKVITKSTETRAATEIAINTYMAKQRNDYLIIILFKCNRFR